MNDESSSLILNQQTLLTPDRKYQRGVVIRWLFAVCLMAATGLPIINFAALKPVLLRVGTFESACDGGLGGCNKQAYLLNVVYVVTNGAVSCAGFVVGSIYDRWGRKFAVAIACCLIPAWGLVGLTSNPKLPWQAQVVLLPLALFLTCMEGVFFYLTTMSYMFDMGKAFPKHWFFSPALANTAATAAWDLSTSVGWIFNVVYFHTKLKLEGICCLYAAAIAIPCVCFAFCVEPPGSAHVVQAEERTTKEESVIKDEKLTWAQCFLAFFIYAATFAASTQMYFYMSVQYEMFQWETDDNQAQADQLMQFFSVILPAAFVANFPMAWILRFGTEVPLLSMLLLGPAWVACSLVRIGWVQYLTCVVFVVYRLIFFTTMNNIPMDFFPKKYFGRLVFGSFTGAGISTIVFGIVLDSVVVKHEAFLSTCVAVEATSFVFIAGLLVSELYIDWQKRAARRQTERTALIN
eukprot:TRINITY_DN8827_c0_g1_i2.p1 TRINITY_DN8827_c0_g1~~TRINITY_DN8827_c0_g1_i2.p1  ORF type:complete len:463 (-),score=117.24 TRINITY_DN8827_c0_g1_i2:99-1487(-)